MLNVLVLLDEFLFVYFGNRFVRLLFLVCFLVVYVWFWLVVVVCVWLRWNGFVVLVLLVVFVKFGFVVSSVFVRLFGVGVLDFVVNVGLFDGFVVFG